MINDNNEAMQVAADKSRAKGIVTNPGKTRVVLFDSQANLAKVDYEALPPVMLISNKCKNLGVCLTSTLSRYVDRARPQEIASFRKLHKTVQNPKIIRNPNLHRKTVLLI